MKKKFEDISRKLIKFALIWIKVAAECFYSFSFKIMIEKKNMKKKLEKISISHFLFQFIVIKTCLHINESTVNTLEKVTSTYHWKQNKNQINITQVIEFLIFNVQRPLFFTDNSQCERHIKLIPGWQACRWIWVNTFLLVGFWRKFGWKRPSQDQRPVTESEAI